MNHNVVVGGFASSERQISDVALALATHCDQEFCGISFRRAMNNRGELERLVRRAKVWTHSAGMMAICGTSPAEITAFAPPVPTSLHALIAKATQSGWDLVGSQLIAHGDYRGAGACIKGFTTELGGHLYDNMRHLGQIALHDALKTGVAAREAGIATGMAFMQDDRLFRPGVDAQEMARRGGVTVVVIPGHHETFVRLPVETAVEYEACLDNVRL